MQTPDLGKVIELLLRENAADGDLLDRYLRERDELAFTEIVRRHGPMVWSVCHRVLQNAQDCEDAFQAVFLLLVRKGGSIGKPGLLANWLHGAAYRTALRARKLRTRRQLHEAQATSPAVLPRDDRAEIREVLDKELAGLPMKYRTVLVLCYLEGRTRKEAAHHLGLPEGTVASRLSSGRAILAKRLTRYGLPSGAVAAFLAETSSAAVPKALLNTIVKAAGLLAAGAAVSSQAMVLMEGVLHTMFLSRLKIAAAMVLVTGMLGTALGAKVLTEWTQGVEPQLVEENRRSQAAEPPEKPQEAQAKTDLQRMQGTWECTGIDWPEVTDVRGGPGGGLGATRDSIEYMTQFQADWMIIKDNTVAPAWGDPHGQAELTFRLGEDKRPKTIDVQVSVKDTPPRVPLQGTYDLDGDKMTLSFPAARPLELGTKLESFDFRFRRAADPKTIQLADFDVANAARFDRQYVGKRFRVTGTLESVTRKPGPVVETNAVYSVTLLQRIPMQDKAFNASEFGFSFAAQAQLAALDRGQQVTIEGECTGKTNSVVTFGNCRIIASDK